MRWIVSVGGLEVGWWVGGGVGGEGQWQGFQSP